MTPDYNTNSAFVLQNKSPIHMPQHLVVIQPVIQLKQKRPIVSAVDTFAA